MLLKVNDWLEIECTWRLYGYFQIGRYHAWVERSGKPLKFFDMFYLDGTYHVFLFGRGCYFDRATEYTTENA